jgi:hypothetical protein
MAQMKVFENELAIGQLEKRKGGYFFLKVDAEVFPINLLYMLREG